jgi:hypothetical protein
VGVPEGKRYLGSPRCRWENKFKNETPKNNLVHELNWLRIATDGWLLSTQEFGVPYNGKNF